MKKIATRWIGGRTTIGVVCVENEIGQRTVRIATVNGFDERDDEQYVMDWGTHLDFSEAKGFFPDHITKENFK